MNELRKCCDAEASIAAKLCEKCPDGVRCSCAAKAKTWPRVAVLLVALVPLATSAAMVRAESDCKPACRISQKCQKDECVDPKWLPVSCAKLPDDPPTLVREAGPGCDATGGNGTGRIIVDKLGPDKANVKGTLRWAYETINAQNRIVECDPKLKGHIVLDDVLTWTKPRTTWDFSRCDVTVTGAEPGQPILVISDTHNVIIHSVRGRGLFTGDPNWLYTAKASFGVMTGDTGSNAIHWPWDDLWDLTPPLLRKSVRNTILDRVTGWGIEDHGIGGMHGGVRDTQVTRSLIANSFHPSSLGAWTAPLPDAKWRLRVMHAYNVWTGCGERQTKPREQAHLWLHVRNLVDNWTFYQYKNFDGSFGLGWPMGLNISDDFTDENDLGWVVGSCFVPGPGSKLSNHPRWGTIDHSGWGLIVGNGWTCEACGPGNCCGPQPCENWNLTACNPKLKNSRYWYEAVEGKNPEGHTWPPDYQPIPLPFALDKARSWIRVLDEVGVVRRNPHEQALIDDVAGRVSGCVVKR